MLFLAFVGGALVGGAAAMLFAPRSGAETRRRIIGAADDTKGVASRMPKAIREAASAAQTAFAAAPSWFPASRPFVKRATLALIPVAASPGRMTRRATHVYGPAPWLP
jgi:YtxH-like protein